MANIPENTTDPILRPVTRLETTTKVFGGAYIPDDEQQRGISNLQAIELAERDQYILSRVGEAEVEPSGDIPGDVGIASLDTSGKLPKAENTTGVVFTDDIQTLENKSIDKNANTVTCSPYEISTSQTLTPTKELNVVITDSVTLTLDNGPYAGYSLPITSQADSSVVFTGPGGSTTNNLLANQKITYTWRGSFWDSDAALAPVYIHASTTVSPSADINYVVDTASAVLTISDGVYSGQEVSVTAEAACSVTYKGINGTTTAPLAAYNRNELVWNGSYWLSTIGAVIEGRTASGSNFTYGGGIDVAVVPDSTETITEDGATLDPSTVSKFILNIDTEGATCSIDDGVTVGQIITLVNANENTVAVSYADFGGDTKTDNILGGNNESYIWSGIHWSSGVVTPDSVTTFGNKTISYNDNNISKYPVMYPTASETSATRNFTKEEYIRINAANFCLTLGTAPYTGYKTTVYAVSGPTYIKYTTHSGNTVCVAIFGGMSVTFTCVNDVAGCWWADSGATFCVYDSAYNNRPTDTIPSNWKDYYGIGTYSFVIGTSYTTIYDIPRQNVNLTVNWRANTYATVIGIQSVLTNANIHDNFYLRRYNNGWSNNWTYIVGTAAGTDITYNVTTNLQTGFSTDTGGVYYTVRNGMCTVVIYKITAANIDNRTMCTGLPKAKFDCSVLMGNATSTPMCTVTISATNLKANVGVAGAFWGTLVYPVADDYVES